MRTRLINHFNKSGWVFCLTALLLCLPFLSQANIPGAEEVKSITGLVTSAETGEPLIGVTVSIKGTPSGTVTDIDGTFSLDVDEGTVLIFSYTGFEPQEVVVGAETTYNIAMKTDTQLLDEVVDFRVLIVPKTEYFVILSFAAIVHKHFDYCNQ